MFIVVVARAYPCTKPISVGKKLVWVSLDYMVLDISIVLINEREGDGMEVL